MHNENLVEMIRSSPFGYAYHKIITDKYETPLDYEFMDINESFMELTGLDKSVIGKTVLEAIPNIKESEFDWIGFYGDIAINGGDRVFEQFSEFNQKWYKVHAYSTVKGYFSTIFVDITEKKEAELIIVEKNNLLQNLLENIPGVSFKALPEKKYFFSYTSKDIEILLGYRVNGLFELIHKDNLDFVQNKLLESQKTKVPLDINFRALNKNGVELWLNLRARFLNKTNLEPVSLNGFLLNITEEINAKKSLNEALSVLDATLESTLDGILVLDLKGNIIKYNLKFIDVCGIDVETSNIIEGLFEQLFDPNEFTKKIIYFNNYPSESATDEILLNDGRFLERYTQPQYINNKIIGRIWCFRDITEKKINQKQIENDGIYIKSILASIPDIMFIFDKNGFFIDYKAPKDAPLAMKERDFLGQSFYDVLPPYLSRELGIGINKILKGEKPDIINYNMNIDGRKGYFECRLTPFGKDNVIAIVRDNTNINKTEEELVMARLVAERANVAKNNYLIKINHQIRTPLNSVIGFSDLLLRTELTELQRQYLENVYISGKTIHGIISDVLDLKKIENETMELNLSDVSIKKIMEESLDIVRLDADHKGLELFISLPQKYPKFIFTDKEKVKQILVNILGNSVKYTKKGEVVLSLEYSNVSEFTGNFTFFVKDTGIGMTIEQREDLKSLRHDGKGLGLTISNLIAKQLNTKIIIESEVNKGTTVSFTLESKFNF